MPWRETLLRCLGPGMLGGATLGDWFRLLRDNQFDVAPSSLVRALSITCQSVQNSLFRQIDEFRFADAVCGIKVPSPVFILGHWRSGTTHLHNLLAVDQRFGFPNNYQTLFPHAFLTMETVHARFIEWFLPKRRPMDNIEWTMKSPQEDEFALCITTFKSPCMGWFFPNRRYYYDRYLTFQDVNEQEIDSWKAELVAFLQRLTWKLKRPLILKSPPHTGRIKHLLDVFPDAKFVHIHRNPYSVFESTRKMLTINFRMHCLQRPPLTALDDWILSQYRTMYESFFDQRHLIPAGQYHELSFEDLEQDPVGQIQSLYSALLLPDFAESLPALQDYVRSIEGFQKNDFPALELKLRRRIAHEWRFCFEKWGYSLNLDVDSSLAEQSQSG